MRERNQEKTIEHLFAVDERLPCRQGTALLVAFARSRPTDFSFLQPNDLINFANSAFAGIPEWDAFSEHYGSCGLCNA